MALDTTHTGPDGLHRGRKLAEWVFPEFEKPDRGIIWYLVAAFGGGGLLIYAIQDQNFLFALIILLFAIILFTHHRQDPMDIPFEIYETGVQIGDRYYLYRELESFAIIYEPPIVERLYLMPRGTVIRKEVSIALKGNDPVGIRSILLDYLREDLEREEESGNDIATRVLKL